MGYLGSIMDEGMQVLNALADDDVSKLNDYSREVFMERCWDCVQEKTFNGWDWHTDMYSFLISLAKEDYEFEDIMKSLDEDEYLKEDYHQTTLLELKHSLIMNWKGAEAAHAFMTDNLHITKFREEAIKEALEANDIPKAYQLALEGIKQDQANKPGLVPTWNHWMLRAAQKEKNAEIIVQYASKLYLDSFHVEGDFYKILKRTIPADKWNEFAEGLAKQALNKQKGKIYTDLCSREKWYNRLMEYIRKQGSIYTLENYEKQLLHDYRDEIIAMYIDHAINQMNQYNRNRKTYQEMCSYLKHASRLGGAEQVKTALEALRKNYARCRALLEELSMMKL